MPLVSVVIPTLRRTKLVARAINSVLAQTFTDFEIIVVIDGPDPETAAALAPIASENLRLIQNEASLGPGAARNLGAEAALGSWIAFLDDDDEWLPQKLELQLAAAPSADQRVIVTCLSYIITPRAHYVWPRRIYDNIAPLDEYLFDRRSLFMGDSYLQTSSIIMPRAFFCLFKFSPRRLHEDWDLWLRATKTGAARIITVAEPLVAIHTEEDRESLGGLLAWRDSLAWVEDNRSLIGRRAYSGFCLTILAPHVIANGELSIFFLMLQRAFRSGHPRPTHLLVYFSFALVPMGWRRRIRGLLTHAPRAT
jgi:glycosyltransferase involved in cell wall biosynthesis